VLEFKQRRLFRKGSALVFKKRLSQSLQPSSEAQIVTVFLPEFSCTRTLKVDMHMTVREVRDMVVKKQVIDNVAGWGFVAKISTENADTQWIHLPTDQLFFSPDLMSKTLHRLEFKRRCVHVTLFMDGKPAVETVVKIPHSRWLVEELEEHLRTLHEPMLGEKAHGYHLYLPLSAGEGVLGKKSTVSCALGNQIRLSGMRLDAQRTVTSYRLSDKVKLDFDVRNKRHSLRTQLKNAPVTQDSDIYIRIESPSHGIRTTLW
jgi:hypothetical protein